ncbi:UNVERIFIED_CONTAM: Non-specific lipid-transfer protein A, partial [Sesamum radiatum]
MLLWFHASVTSRNTYIARLQHAVVGVKTVKGMADTTADKRACCSCVKAAANRCAELKDVAAQSLPTKCGIQMDVPISRSVHCD